MNKFVGLVLLAVCLLALFGQSLMLNQVQGAVPGGWSKVSTKDAQVQAAAKFAVAEEAKKSETELTLVSVKSAKQQVVAGMNYEMTLRVKKGDETKKAVARVWLKLDQTHELTSWTWE